MLGSALLLCEPVLALESESSSSADAAVRGAGDCGLPASGTRDTDSSSLRLLSEEAVPTGTTTDCLLVRPLSPAEGGRVPDASSVAACGAPLRASTACCLRARLAALRSARRILRIC